MRYIISLYTIVLFTCQGTNKSAKDIKELKNMYELTVHLEKNTFIPFEPIKIGVQIMNNSTSELKIRNVKLDWEELSFSNPSMLHLIDENGKNLASIYEKPRTYFENIESIIVSAKNEEWFYFPLNSHFPKLKTGDYKLRLDFSDSEGNILKSNTASFKIIPFEFTRNPNEVDVRISTSRQEIEGEKDIEVHIEFINNSDSRITFIKPNFDSFYGWTNPTYYFIIREKTTDRVVPLSLRSGTMEIPKYNDSTMISLNSKDKKMITVKLPPYPKLSKPGDYTIQMRYLVRNNKIGKSGTILDKKMNWNKDVFVGLIESNVLTLKVERK